MHIPTSGAWLTRSSPNVVAIVTMLIYVRKNRRGGRVLINLLDYLIRQAYGIPFERIA